MRIALILLLLLALAAVPGSLIPQERVDALKASQWKDAHETLTPVYEKLGIFNVYGSPWFAAIYILLVVSLVGCIVPRTFVYARGLRAQPPAAPRNLTRLPSHASYGTAESPDVVLERARTVLRRRRYRLRREPTAGTVSAERGYLREVGNLVFHLAVLVVLVGFATRVAVRLQGRRDPGAGHAVQQQPHPVRRLRAGQPVRPRRDGPVHLHRRHFDVEWLTSGRGRDGARLRGRAPLPRDAGRPEKSYDLRVNHPLTIGGTELFLIGHGYAPVVTVRDGEGNVAASGPVVFLPMGPDLFSFGVIKAPDAQPGPDRARGLLLPDVRERRRRPGQPRRQRPQPAALAQRLHRRPEPRLRCGAVGLHPRQVQGDPLPGKNGQPLRVDLAPGDTVELPDGLGSVTFEKVVSWQRIQISQTPARTIALLGVVLALLGLMGSLFIRSPRVWVRVTEGPDGTLVEVAALDRSGGADTDAVLSDLVAALQEPDGAMTDAAWGP